MKGIDVSKWNGDIDWAKVSTTDVGYAIIRCGYGNNYSYQDDAYWEKNIKGCEENNIPYGVYIYSYATTVAEAKSESAHVLRLIEGHTINFPIYLDVEDETQAKLSKSKLAEIISTFVTAIHNEGYEVGIYANLNWWTNYIDTSIANNNLWYKWVAQYNNTGATYTGVYQMWQCTSEGSVDGISGNVDLNFWFDQVRDRSYNARSYPKVVTVVKKVTAPGRASIGYIKKGNKKVKIKLKKVTGAQGYQIQYSLKKSFKGKTIKNTTKRTVTIKKLKLKKWYYFRVKAYKKDGSKKVFSKKWSTVKKVRLK
jgi:GH25 family lysozyme M1 (1,4-beta-N-acetylmuramidase)